ncbi:hypothetical protein HZA42_03625 [Candidatus Peregrinibacteria bacterium]|nr:hypothetical protein [Candidatus Peregrinibacteria bacterium]
MPKQKKKLSRGHIPQENRRIDEENHLGFDSHAARALSRFQGRATPEERRAAVATAKLRNADGHNGEADVMRKKLLAILDQVEGKTPKQE